MKKEIWEFVLENSFALFLMTVTACVIEIVFGVVELTTFQQMSVIMASMYGSCRLYQAYRRSMEKEYSLLGGRNLEKLFAVLTLFLLSVALYVDVCTIARL